MKQLFKECGLLGSMGIERNGSGYRVEGEPTGTNDGNFWLERTTVFRRVECTIVIVIDLSEHSSRDICRN
jgi:hypothetical protein